MNAPPEAPAFRLGARQAWIAAGFVVTTLLAQQVMAALGHNLLEPDVNENRARLVYSYLSKPEAEDVLVIGSSRVQGGIDARIVQELLRAGVGEELDVFKLGLAGLRPWFLSQLLRDGVARRPPRELLVIAIEPRFFVYPTRARRSDPRREGVSPAEGADDPIRGEWEADKIVAAFWSVFDGLKALWNLDWIFDPDTRAARDFHVENLGERFSVQERMRVEARQARQRAGRPDLFDLPPGMRWEWSAPDSPDQEGFRRCLEILRELPCDVLFVRMPLQAGFEQAHMVAETQRFREQIVPRLTAAGFRYLDLSAEPYPSTEPFFYSMTHLNRRGCVLTSRALVSGLLAPAILARRAR